MLDNLTWLYVNMV